MAEPRITGLPANRVGVVTRVIYWLVERAVGKVTEPVAVMAHNYEVLRAYAGFEQWARKAKRVDGALKALASIKAATLVGCPF